MKRKTTRFINFISKKVKSPTQFVSGKFLEGRVYVITYIGMIWLETYWLMITPKALTDPNKRNVCHNNGRYTFFSQ